MLLRLFGWGKTRQAYAHADPEPQLDVETGIIPVPTDDNPYYFYASWNRQGFSGKLIAGGREYQLPRDAGIAVGMNSPLTVVLTDAGGKEVYRKTQVYDPDTGRLKDVE